MAFMDLLSNSLVSPTIEWAKNANIPQALGTLLAAYAVPAIAGTLVRKPYRGQLQMALAQPLLGQAFDYLQRPQRMRDMVMKQQIADQALTPIAPSPDAKPVMTWEDIPFYARPKVREKFPELFQPNQVPAPGEMGPPAPTPVSPSMNILGDMPFIPRSTPADLFPLLQKQELLQAENERYRQAGQAVRAEAEKNENLVLIPKIGAEGHLTYEAQQKKTKPGASWRLGTFPVTTADGTQMIEKRWYNPETREQVPVEGSAQTRYDPRDDPNARYQMAAVTQMAAIQASRLRDLLQERDKLKTSSVPDPNRIAQIEMEAQKVEQYIKSMYQAAGIPLPSDLLGGSAVPQGQGSAPQGQSSPSQMQRQIEMLRSLSK